MKFSKNLVVLAMCVLASGCAEKNVPESNGQGSVAECGNLVVKVSHESAKVRSVADYGRVLSDESVVHKLDVFVFDATTGCLERSTTKSSTDAECRFELPVGEKIVYAVVNGPDMSRVQSLDQIRALKYDLSEVTIKDDGFMMIGSEECSVSQGAVSSPEIFVRRMVSRVELRSIKCNIASQYGAMKVECAYLGNAYSSQLISDDKREIPIGLNGITGSCSEYFYRPMALDVVCGETSSESVYLYCQPDGGDGCSCLYLLVSIGQGKYYYRVPLDKGLFANTTCVVNAVITNLGAPLPPDGVVQKGEIVASVIIEGWDTGSQYDAEF